MERGGGGLQTDYIRNKCLCSMLKHSVRIQGVEPAGRVGWRDKLITFGTDVLYNVTAFG